MLIFKIVDAVFLVGLISALVWAWRHQVDLRKAVLQNDAMPREATRGLVYGFLIILLAGAVMVSGYWLLF